MLPVRPRPVRPVRAAVVAVLVAGLATAMLPATPAAAATVRIDPRLFGMHDYDARSGSWPAVSPGSIRLWDSDVTWKDIEPTQGAFDWTRLDAIVDEAGARGAEVTLVLGQTPAWADDAALVGEGPQFMPRMDAWTAYVSAVATRYRGRIQAYQVWNEGNVVNSWAQNRDNTPARLAELTSAAYGVVKSIDSSALVVSPAFATRLSSQRTYLRTFFRARPEGRPVWQRVDAISLNLYPLAGGTPETSMTLLRSARKSLGLVSVPTSKPIWNTEINYGLATGGSGASSGLASSKQAAFVVRTYLLNAAAGVKRVHWYMWDRPEIGNTKLVAPDRVTPTLAGKAFGLVGRWMRGATLVGPSRSAAPCTKDAAGTYTCTLALRAGVRRVYWNPAKSVRATTAKSAKYSVSVYGVRKAVTGGARLKVTDVPVMVWSKR